MKTNYLLYVLFLFLSCLPFQFVRNEINCESECSNRPRTQGCIKKIMDNGSQNIKGIYETELKRNQEINGRMKIKFLINGNGKVGKIEVVNSTLNDSTFLKEIINEIGLWNFCADSSGKPVEVVFPFIFEIAK